MLMQNVNSKMEVKNLEEEKTPMGDLETKRGQKTLFV